MNEDKNPGIACPRCGCRHMKAIDTRRLSKRMVRWRRCRHCGRKVRTQEIIVQIPDD